MTSETKTDRRGFLKGMLGAAGAAAIVATPAVKLTQSIEKRKPQEGEKFKLYPGPNTKCLRCDESFATPYHPILSAIYGGATDKDGELEHIFLLDAPTYCVGCGARISKVLHTNVRFIQELENEPTTTA